MFTGIIENIGEIVEIAPKEQRISAKIKCNFSHIKLGESIAIDGACLTVTKKSFLFFRKQNYFWVDVSKETLDKTNLSGWQRGKIVNLEKSLRLNGKIDGHLVLGHVDGLGKVVSIKQIDDNYNIEVKIPKDFLNLIVYKGSITFNGVSLTINQLKDDFISLNIIPYTWSHTSLRELKVDENANLEFDIIGKFVARNLIQNTAQKNL
ncbi:MAG: riboflavin synthase [Alphaproteobacteria bacterium]